MAKLPKSQAKFVPLLLLLLLLVLATPLLRRLLHLCQLWHRHQQLPTTLLSGNFLKTQTTIDRVKIFDTNPDILKAFANTKTNITKIWKILPSGGTSEPFEGKKSSWEFQDHCYQSPAMQIQWQGLYNCKLSPFLCIKIFSSLFVC